MKYKTIGFVFVFPAILAMLFTKFATAYLGFNADHFYTFYQAYPTLYFQCTPSIVFNNFAFSFYSIYFIFSFASLAVIYRHTPNVIRSVIRINSFVFIFVIVNFLYSLSVIQNNSQKQINCSHIYGQPLYKSL